MKVGDLVWKSVKAVAEGSMVSVLWSHEGPGHRNDWLYRASVLEVINESR